MSTSPAVTEALLGIAAAMRDMSSLGVTTSISRQSDLLPALEQALRA